MQGERPHAGLIDPRADGVYDTLLTALNDVGQGMLLVEEERIRYANDAFCGISGYSRPKLSALPTFLGLIAQDQRRPMEDRMRRCLRGWAVEDRCETAILHRSGRRVDLEVAIRLRERSNRPPQLVVIARDITEPKQLKERLESTLGTLVAVHEADRILTSTLEQEEIGMRLIRIVLRVCDLGAAVVDLRDEDGRWNLLATAGPDNLWRAASATAEARVARHRAVERKHPQPFRLGKPEKDGASSVGLCLPLVMRSRVIGVLEAYGGEGLVGKATVETLESVTRRAASALENAWLYQKVAEHERRLEELVSKLLVAQEEERRRVACDIHDGLTQLAVAAHHSLQAYAEDLHPGVPSSQEKLVRALELVEQTVGEARHVIASLRPTALDDLGLASDFRSQVDSLRSEGWEVVYDEDLWQERLPAEIETTLYRIAQEALTNVRKHAGTTRVCVTLTQLAQTLCLRVRDWGRGFDDAAQPQNGDVPGERVGLCSMRERAALLGGRLTIHSRPGAGTCVLAEIPLPNSTPAQGMQMPSPTSESAPSRLVIADDHALVREGLRTLLASEPNLKIVGEATDGREALELCHRLRPDLVLMDARMPKMDGLAATRTIKAKTPDTEVLILTAYESPEYLLEAVRAGAGGYVTKATTRHDLVAAVYRALNSEHPLDQELAMQLLHDLAAEDGHESGVCRESGKQTAPFAGSLTPRELEVLRLLAQGQTNRQISHNLVVSTATVKVHVQHILEKLDVSDRTQAAVRASEAGLLRPAP